MKAVLSILAALVAASFSISAQVPEPKLLAAENDKWSVEYDLSGIRTVIDKSDPFLADCIGRRGALGSYMLNYKVQDGVWLTVPLDRRTMSVDGNEVTYVDHTIGDVLRVTQTFSLQQDGISWDIHIDNLSRFPVLVGDLAVTVPWSTEVDDEDTDGVFELTYTKHSNISGDGSFIYFTRFGGEAPYPLLLPEAGTPLEYCTNARSGYQAYIRSGKSGRAETRGTWRQEHTVDHLAPAGEAGSTLDYGFRIMSAGSYQQIRDLLYANRSVDVMVAPGLTLPRGHKGSFALRTECQIDSVVAEYPLQTRLSKRSGDGDVSIWDVEFDRLGENRITVWFDGGRKTYLEYFSCLSPETLLRKRSSFLVDRQQFRNTGRWYDGLYGEYDMAAGELRGPDNPDIYDETLTYFLASDDPILGKAPFLASKNAVFPDKKEIESLEYHLEHFVWGGLQRTADEKPLPYGVYGTPNWYINRHQDLRETYSEYKTDRLRTWRTYDYPHVFMLWWEMYKIASRYPDMCSYASADEYLERAYQTARAYWHYPTELLGEYYETFKWGAYNENVLPDIIDELSRRGRTAEADTLRKGWEKKTRYFVSEGRYPYRSEYATDRTAFESTFALADYGLRRGVEGLQRDEVCDFMERQYLANLSCRGVLENQWYIMGGDFHRSSDWSVMSYMARMGGWGVLGYGLRFADDPYDAIRLGYSSYLGQFGLINAGDEASDYGYWYPGVEKDGSMGQAFTPLKFGSAWIGTQEPRGPWRYCGEGDLGMCAVTRMAETILADDPVFGWTLFGGREFRQSKEGFSFIPDDGVRTRIAVVNDDRRTELSLDRDNWSGATPVRVDAALRNMELVLENGVGGQHDTMLRISSLSYGKKAKASVSIDGRKVQGKRDLDGNLVFVLHVSRDSHSVKVSF